MTQKLNTRSLDEQRNEYKQRRFLAMPIAGTIAWLIVGIAGATLSEVLKVWVLYGATGSYALTAGERAIASGESSIAMGLQTQSIGDYSVALGNFAIANGRASIALGEIVTASGKRSLATGFLTNAAL